MIFWYDGLLMDKAVRKKEEKCKRIIEKRSIWQKLPWKKSFYILMLANNSENLFEIMATNQMFFRYYGYTDIYIVGVSQDYEGAVQMLRRVMADGYAGDADFDPRKVYTKERFSAGKS